MAVGQSRKAAVVLLTGVIPGRTLTLSNVSARGASFVFLSLSVSLARKRRTCAVFVRDFSLPHTVDAGEEVARSYTKRRRPGLPATSPTWLAEVSLSSPRAPSHRRRSEANERPLTPNSSRQLRPVKLTSLIRKLACLLACCEPSLRETRSTWWHHSQPRKARKHEYLPVSSSGALAGYWLQGLACVRATKGRKGIWSFWNEVRSVTPAVAEARERAARAWERGGSTATIGSIEVFLGQRSLVRRGGRVEEFGVLFRSDECLATTQGAGAPKCLHARQSVPAYCPLKADSKTRNNIDQPALPAYIYCVRRIPRTPGHHLEGGKKLAATPSRPPRWIPRRAATRGTSPRPHPHDTREDTPCRSPRRLHEPGV